MGVVERAKLKAELLRVQAARAEMEYIIAQRTEEIARVEDNIKKQDEAEKGLILRLDSGEK